MAGITKAGGALTLALLLLSAAPTWAQEDKDSPSQGWFTDGNVNGRFWGQLNHEQKLIFVLSYREGFSIAAAAADANKSFEKIQWWAAGRSTHEEVVLGVDAFYADPANRRIAVRFAIMMFGGKTAGAAPENLNSTLMKLRADSFKWGN